MCSYAKQRAGPWSSNHDDRALAGINSRTETCWQPWKKRLSFYEVRWSHSTLYGFEWSKGGFWKSKDCLMVFIIPWSAQNVPIHIRDDFLGSFFAHALPQAVDAQPCWAPAPLVGSFCSNFIRVRQDLWAAEDQESYFCIYVIITDVIRDPGGPHKSPNLILW